MLCLAVVMLALAWVGRARAQASVQRDSADEPLEQFVVTGTLLHKSQSDTPVVSLTAEQIRQSGLTTVADIVGAGTPRYRATWSNTYSLRTVSATLSSYYVSGFAETAVDATGSSSACLYSTNYCHVASFIYFDLTGTYFITPQLTALLAIQNLMDRLPPFDPANYAGVNYNPTYHQAGIVGRFFRVGFGYRF
jgi:hypothetical protein